METPIELTYILGSGPMDSPVFGFTQDQDCEYTESYEYIDLDTSYINKSPDGLFFVLDSAELSLASDKETMTVEATITEPPNDILHSAQVVYEIELVDPCLSSNFDSITVNDMQTHVKANAVD